MNASGLPTIKFPIAVLNASEMGMLTGIARSQASAPMISPSVITMLAAGRGFVHVSPEGWVEPCPATPYSDSSLTEMSLREALESPLLKAIRDSGADLHETSGGCALFDKQEWLKSLIAS